VTLSMFTRQTLHADASCQKAVNGWAAQQAGVEPRGQLHCVLARPAGQPELHVMCVHLGLSEAPRHHLLARLCEAVQHSVAADAPLVVAGDFNDC